MRLPAYFRQPEEPNARAHPPSCPRRLVQVGTGAPSRRRDDEPSTPAAPLGFRHMRARAHAGAPFSTGISLPWVGVREPHSLVEPLVELGLHVHVLVRYICVGSYEFYNTPIG
eukprot:scaffold7267_cov395-Prasinococcus_capsulatus_cf.AAC.3